MGEGHDAVDSRSMEEFWYHIKGNPFDKSHEAAFNEGSCDKVRHAMMKSEYHDKIDRNLVTYMRWRMDGRK